MPALRHRNFAHCREAPLYWPSPALVRASLFERVVSNSCWKMCCLLSLSVVGCGPSIEERRLPLAGPWRAQRDSSRQDRRPMNPVVWASRQEPPSEGKRAWAQRGCCPCSYPPTLCQNNPQSELRPKVSALSKEMGLYHQSMARNGVRKSGWAGAC